MDKVTGLEKKALPCSKQDKEMDKVSPRLASKRDNKAEKVLQCSKQDNNAEKAPSCSKRGKVVEKAPTFLERDNEEEKELASWSRGRRRRHGESR